MTGERGKKTVSNLLGPLLSISRRGPSFYLYTTPVIGLGAISFEIDRWHRGRSEGTLHNDSTEWPGATRNKKINPSSWSSNVCQGTRPYKLIIRKEGKFSISLENKDTEKFHNQINNSSDFSLAFETVIWLHGCPVTCQTICRAVTGFPQQAKRMRFRLVFHFFPVVLVFSYLFKVSHFLFVGCVPLLPSVCSALHPMMTSSA